MTSEGRVRNDLGAINHWLAWTRLRGVGAVTAFAALLHLQGLPGVDLPSVVAVGGALGLFSLWGLRWRKPGGSEFRYFCVQHAVDLVGITLGLGLAVTGGLGLLFRPLYALVVIPASLVSVEVGLLAAAGATLGHELLLGLARDFSLETLLSVHSLAPAFFFFLVAQQCFFYGAHLEQKNQALASLAARLDDSRKELAELVDVARVLNSTIDPPALLARVNRLALDRLGGDWSATLLVDPARRTFRLAATATGSERDAAPALELPMDRWPPIERLARERHVVLVAEDAAAMPDVLTGDRRFTRVLLAGLFRDRELVGALAVGQVSPALDEDGEGAPRRLVDIAEHATIALRNAQLLEEAREASALKSEFVSTMSHELRTPLNVILGYTEMLREDAEARGGEPHDLLDRIDTCGRELLELVDATLQVGRLEAGAIKVERQLVSVTDLQRALQASIAGLPRPPGVGFSWHCSARPAGTIRTDRAKVALIVRNLVSNAFKFTHEGSVRVYVRESGGVLEIVVRDTGIGVAPEKLPVMFEMFRQLGAPQSGGPRGVGLGLYIVDQLVRRLGGRIDVESTPGLGSSFRVLLPGYVDPPAAPAAAGPVAEPRATATPYTRSTSAT